MPTGIHLTLLKSSNGLTNLDIRSLVSMSAPELRQMVFRISIRYVHLSKQQIVDLQACKLGVIMVIAVSCVKLLSATVVLSHRWDGPDFVCILPCTYY